MRCAVLLLAGCALQAKGATSLPLDHRSTVDGGTSGELDIGIGGDDGKQGGAMMIGVARAAMRGPDAPPGTAIMFSGFYQRAWSSAHSFRRLYGRLGLGGSVCTNENGEAIACADDPSSPDASIVEVGAGIALTAGIEDSRGFGGAGVALGVVYSYQTRRMLPATDFIGVELAVHLCVFEYKWFEDRL